jgi:hypothetical protein
MTLPGSALRPTRASRSWWCDLDAAQHLLHEVVIAAFRREQGRDPATKAEYRAYLRKLFEEATPRWKRGPTRSSGW